MVKRRWGLWLGGGVSLVLLLGLVLSQKKAVAFAEVDLFSGAPCQYRTINIFPPEQDAGGGTFRWVLGRVAGVRFYSQNPAPSRLRLALRGVFPDQRIGVLLNGSPAGEIVAASGNATQVLDMPVALRKGLNELAFVSSVYNGVPARLLNDDRPLAFMLQRLTIRLR